MNKGQLTQQIFIYIASAAVFLIILLLGYRYVIGLIAHQDTVLLVDFKTDIENAVEKLKLRRGSVDLITFVVPTTFRELCIYDSSDVSPEQANNTQQYRAWQTGTENIFLVPKQDIAIQVKDIRIEGGSFCKPITGRFELRMEGEGRKVLISP
jgi:hypothetical protein